MQEIIEKGIRYVNIYQLILFIVYPMGYWLKNELTVLEGFRKK
tara:strand:+ start:335 stop:463 length:129 start_codon:yes stop_codon:yes gene_type:complete